MKALKNLILFIICLIGGCEATMAQTNGTNNNYIPANPGSTLLQGYWYNLTDTTAITGRQLRGYAGGGKSVRIALWADVLSAVAAGGGVTPSNTVTFTNKTFSSSTNILGGVSTAGFSGHATGDLYYDNAGILTPLPIGSNFQYLTAFGGVPVWSTPGNFINNGTLLQTSANYNIDGNGTANNFSATGENAFGSGYTSNIAATNNGINHRGIDVYIGGSFTSSPYTGYGIYGTHSVVEVSATNTQSWTTLNGGLGAVLASVRTASGATGTITSTSNEILTARFRAAGASITEHNFITMLPPTGAGATNVTNEAGLFIYTMNTATNSAYIATGIDTTTSAHPSGNWNIWSNTAYPNNLGTGLTTVGSLTSNGLITASNAIHLGSGIPATPSANITLYSSNDNRLSVLGTNGFSAIWNLTGLSATRTLTFPDVSGTVATINAGQTFTSAIWNGSVITPAYIGTGTPTSGYYVDGGTGAWTALPTTLTNPMTTLGDIIYGDVSGVQTRLPGNTTTTQKFLTQTGTGSASAAPTYFDLFGTLNTWNAQQVYNQDAFYNSGRLIHLYNSANTFYATLGAGTLTAVRSINIGDESGTLARVSGNLGTPTTLVGTNITGTASALNIGGSAPAGNLTGSTLASGVTASSLLSAAGGTFGTNAYTSTAIPTAANPSATIGLTANNGSASTFMRSDATPALLQSIVPTWTGLHTYSPTIAANTVVDGIYLNDITAATSGNQQYSPGIHWHGNGWKTNSTAASQSVDFRSYVIPIQGTTNTTANLVFESSINGGAYGNQSLITSDGKIRAGNALNAGTDISLSAVLSNQSVIQTFWGLQLSGNTQTSAATYTPAQVGTARQDYHVVIPMVQTAAAGLAVLGVGSQTGNYFEITSNTNKTTSHGDLLSFNSAGSLGIGTTSPDASAIQDIASTTKGILFPRMTTTQQNAISSPATGLQIFNTTFNTPANYNGTGWRIPAVINQVAPTNGQMIFGNGADFTVATPSVANGITYTPGTGSGTFGLGTLSGLTGITSGGTINFSSLTASKIVFTDASKNLTSTAPGTSSQYFAGDGSLQTAYVNPMTTLGDIIYGGASGVQTRLPGNTTSSTKILSQTGTGSVSAAPIWLDLFNSTQYYNAIQTFGSGINIQSDIVWLNAPYTANLRQGTQSANAIITIPNATSTIATLALSETLTNKTLTTPKLTGYTVATLPAAGTIGRMAYVTDALTPSFLVVVVGGGSTVTPVFDNGTNWVSY